MDDDLNIARSAREAGRMSRTRGLKPKAPFSIRGWAIAAAVAVLAIVVISGTSASRVHVIERY